MYLVLQQTGGVHIGGSSGTGGFGGVAIAGGDQNDIKSGRDVNYGPSSSHNVGEVKGNYNNATLQGANTGPITFN